MGQILRFDCYRCGHTWDLFLGIPMGSKAVTYHCNNCGKSVTLEKAPHSKCECGGRFKVYPKRYFCPECGKETVRHCTLVGMWD